MKRFTIPLIDVVIFVYVGENDWKRFVHDVVRTGTKVPQEEKEAVPGRGSGRASGGYVWVSTTDDRNLICHELTHAVDSIMSHIGSRDKELRAFVAGWLFDHVLSWAESQA